MLRRHAFVVQSVSTIIFILSLTMLVTCQSTGSARGQDSGYPSWFLNPPEKDGYLYAVGVAQKQNPQLAREASSARARNEIARVLEVRVATMTKDFLEEAGVGETSQATEFTQSVSKQISDQTISGSKVKENYIDDTTDPDTFYTLIELNLADLSGYMDDMVSVNNAAYAKLDANMSLEDLVDELKSIKENRLKTPEIAYDEEDLADKIKKQKEEIKKASKSTNNKKKKNEEVKVKTGKQPDWITRTPTDPEYYTGIGQGNSLQQSQNAAIANLVSQIRVSIRSEINDYLQETNGVTEEQVTQNINLQVKEDVEDLEFMEAWYDTSKGYWAYYRLNIAEYKRKQLEKQEQAKEIALDFLGKSDNEKDPALKLKYAFLGYYHVGKYVTKALKADYKGREVILVNELTSRMQQIMNNFVVKSTPGSASIKKINPVPVEVAFTITNDGMPLKNFPVKFSGNGLEMNESSTTDSKGTAVCIISKATGKKEKTTATATIDFTSFVIDAIQNEEVSGQYVERLAALGTPSRELIVSITPPIFEYNVYFEGDVDTNDKYRSKLNAMNSKFKNSLIKKTGAKFVDSSDSLEMNTTIDGEMTTSERSGTTFHFTRLMVTVSIYDKDTDEEVFTLSIPKRIKGGSTTPDKGLQKAIDKYLETYNDGMVDRVVAWMNGEEYEDPEE
jgi:hypothetical protein